MFATKSLQLCPTLCDPIDRSPPGSPVPGILQARTLEWGAIAFSESFMFSMLQKYFASTKMFNRRGLAVSVLNDYHLK